MQIPKTVVALANLIPHSKTLMALARKTRFVLRIPKKIWPDQILRAVLVAVCEGTPHLRAIAKNLAGLSDAEPSRQAVFERLKHDAAPSFFACAFRQMVSEQCRRFAAFGGSGLGRALRRAGGVFGRILIGLLKEGDRLLRDMGYFCLEGFREIARRGAWFLTRIPEGTVLCDAAGEELNLPGLLRGERSGLFEMRVRVGRATPFEGRLVAARIEPGKAAQRRRQLRKRLREEGGSPRRDQLEMCDWVVVFTNSPSDLIDGESVAQLYRARWMVEIFFKGMKSGQDLEKWSRHRTNENTILCLAYAQMMIGVISLNLWRMMGRIVNLAPADEAGPTEPGRGQPTEVEALKVIGPIKAFESLVPWLRDVFCKQLRGRSPGEELHRLARYATQESRLRISLESRILSLFT